MGDLKNGSVTPRDTDFTDICKHGNAALPRVPTMEASSLGNLSMKKLLLTSLVLGSVAASSAFAATPADLSGPSISATGEFSSGSSSATDGTSDTGKTSALGLQARYDWALSPTFAIGLGGSYTSGTHQHGTYANGNAASVNNRYSLDIIPTVALPNDFLVYGKLSSIYGNAASNDGVNSSNVQGVGYGLGVRKMLDKNMYLQVGYDLNKFNDVTFSNGTTSSLQENVVSFGLGYKF
jgi:opacity protein-like surface antigen